MVLGIVGIWIELKTPGFGVPGVLGISAFLVLFFGHHLAGMAQYSSLLLIVAGIGLVAMEIFILPGTGAFALLGALGILVGLVLIFQDFSIFKIGSLEDWQVVMVRDAMLRVMGALAVALGAAIVVARFFPSVPFLGRLVLKAELAAEQGYVAPGVEVDADVIGQVGVAVTTLRPAGRVEIKGETYDVVTDGEFLDKGEKVRVVKADANRLVVEKVVS
jgi:membrane-bound serine protease (ClpP class)